MVIPAGVEPAIFWMRTRRPRPLDDGTEFLDSFPASGCGSPCGDLCGSRTRIDGMKTRCTNRYTKRPAFDIITRNWEKYKVYLYSMPAPE